MVEMMVSMKVGMMVGMRVWFIVIMIGKEDFLNGLG